MASVLPAVLLCLVLHCVASEMPLCAISNGSYGGDFTLMINPGYYQPNQTYNVTVSGTNVSDTKVALHASYNEIHFGTWMNADANCSGVYGTRSLSFTEKWTSPSNQSIEGSIRFKAFVMFGNMTYYKSLMLSSAPMTTAPPTTMLNSTMTSAATVKTTSGGITFKPLGGFASILLLFISVRELLL